jgi:hypothetical protein
LAVRRGSCSEFTRTARLDDEEVLVRSYDDWVRSLILVLAMFGLLLGTGASAGYSTLTSETFVVYDGVYEPHSAAVTAESEERAAKRDRERTLILFGLPLAGAAMGAVAAAALGAAGWRLRRG